LHLELVGYVALDHGHVPLMGHGPLEALLAVLLILLELPCVRVDEIVERVIVVQALHQVLEQAGLVRGEAAR